MESRNSNKKLHYFISLTNVLMTELLNPTADTLEKVKGGIENLLPAVCAESNLYSAYTTVRHLLMLNESAHYLLNRNKDLQSEPEKKQTACIIAAETSSATEFDLSKSVKLYPYKHNTGSLNPSDDSKLYVSNKYGIPIRHLVKSQKYITQEDLEPLYCQATVDFTLAELKKPSLDMMKKMVANLQGRFSSLSEMKTEFHLYTTPRRETPKKTIFIEAFPDSKKFILNPAKDLDIVEICKIFPQPEDYLKDPDYNADKDMLKEGFDNPFYQKQYQEIKPVFFIALSDLSLSELLDSKTTKEALNKLTRSVHDRSEYYTSEPYKRRFNFWNLEKNLKATMIEVLPKTPNEVIDKKNIALEDIRVFMPDAPDYGTEEIVIPNPYYRDSVVDSALKFKK